MTAESKGSTYEMASCHQLMSLLQTGPAQFARHCAYPAEFLYKLNEQIYLTLYMHHCVDNQSISCYTVLLGPTFMSSQKAYLSNTSEYPSKHLGFGKV